MKKFFPNWRGFTIQFFAIVVLPLTLLLLIIAFGSVSLHQKDMRALVSERDARAVQSAAAALESEIHHRMAGISSLARFVDLSGNISFEQTLTSTRDLMSDFDGGVAFISPNRQLLDSEPQNGLWNAIIHAENVQFASASNPDLKLSDLFTDPGSGRVYVIVSAYSPSIHAITAGAFSPESLASETLSTTYPAGSQATIYLLDRSGHVIFASGTSAAQSLSPDHPGVSEALRGESGTRYVPMQGGEHVIAFSAIPSTGWALVTEEDWHTVVSPSLQTTQLAPLVLVPAFILALFAIWFGVRQIVQPLQKLEEKAAALAWGDFSTIQEPVGGISEVQHLQSELAEMANRVKAAQEGLHDYIAAITSAQEEERARLARELHDDTIQSVIALKQRIQLAQQSIKDQGNRQSLKQLEDLAEETVENLRRLTRALRPIYLEDLGLVTALEMLVRETSQANDLQVEFQQSGRERRLPSEVELALYRIAQEALNNVLHHAQAKHASLSISFQKDIRLEVKDDGAGFVVPRSPTEFAPNGHFGLLGIRERVDLIHGKLIVESQPGRGTSLAVQLEEPTNRSRNS